MALADNTRMRAIIVRIGTSVNHRVTPMTVPTVISRSFLIIPMIALRIAVDRIIVAIGFIAHNRYSPDNQYIPPDRPATK
jgi:hypothetical protein